MMVWMISVDNLDSVRTGMHHILCSGVLFWRTPYGVLASCGDDNVRLSLGSISLSFFAIILCQTILAQSGQGE